MSAALAVSSGGAGAKEESASQDQTQERSRWEQGAPDYRGADSFDNIIKKIDSTMSTPDSGKFLYVLTISPFVWPAFFYPLKTFSLNHNFEDYMVARQLS